MTQQIMSGLLRVRTDKNGEYTLVLPNNTIEDVFVSLKSKVTLKEVLKDMVEDIDDARLTLTEDLAAVVNSLAGLIDTRLPLNHIYRENFKTKDNVSITHGTYTGGGIKASQEQNMDFKLKNPIELKKIPEKFKITQMSKYVGSPQLTFLITFNAKDSQPQWFDCTASVTSGLFTVVPEIPNKEAEKPYALDFRVRCNCNDSSTFEIIDFMVLHV